MGRNISTFWSIFLKQPVMDKVYWSHIPLRRYLQATIVTYVLSCLFVSKDSKGRVAYVISLYENIYGKEHILYTIK